MDKMTKEKISIKLREEEDWVRFPLAIGPIVIVTTVNKRNVPNAAPIACVTPAAAADPPMLIFTCNIKHDKKHLRNRAVCRQHTWCRNRRPVNDHRKIISLRCK